MTEATSEFKIGQRVQVNDGVRFFGGDKGTIIDKSASKKQKGEEYVLVELDGEGKYFLLKTELTAL